MKDYKKHIQDYEEITQRKQKQIGDFHIIWAFDKQTLEQKALDLGLSGVSDLISVGSGGYIPRTRKAEFINMMKHLDDEVKTAMLSNNDFAKAVFYHELANHEAFYAYEDMMYELAESCFGFTKEEFDNHEQLVNIYKEAKKEYWHDMCKD